MKKIILIILFCLFFVKVYASESSKIESTDTYVIQNIIDENSADSFSFKETAKDFAKGNFKIKLDETINKITTLFFHTLKENLGLVSKIIGIMLICSLLENSKKSLKTDINYDFLICLMAVSYIGISVFHNAMEISVTAMDNLILFTNSLFGIMLTALAGGGNVATATSLHPILIASGGFVLMICKKQLIPFCSVILALKLANYYSGDDSAKKISEISIKLIKWFMGIIFTVYLGIVTVIGMTVPKFDGITVRTAKYAVSNMVPVVGGILSDSADLLLASSAVIKNSLGISGLIGISTLMLTPLIEIFVIAFSLALASAITEPVCDKRLNDCVLGIAEIIFMIFYITVACVSLMLISTGVLIGIGGI